MPITKEHYDKCAELIKKMSPTMCVRELCTPPLALGSFSIDGENVEFPPLDSLPALKQEEAEKVVYETLEKQRRAYQKFQMNKEVIMERYYDLYNQALNNNDIKTAKTVLDKLATELGLSVESVITASSSDKIILKIE